MRKSISVTQLAAYADDPVGFCARRGGAQNRKAAIAGKAYEKEVIRPSPPALHNILFWLIMIVCSLIIASKYLQG